MFCCLLVCYFTENISNQLSIQLGFNVTQTGTLSHPLPSFNQVPASVTEKKPVENTTKAKAEAKYSVMIFFLSFVQLFLASESQLLLLKCFFCFLVVQLVCLIEFCLFVLISWCLFLVFVSSMISKKFAHFLQIVSQSEA